jgi:DNA polymerase-1
MSQTEGKSNEQNRLLIVDGHAYAYRSFYAIRNLSSPTGEPTNAIYGFIKALSKLRDFHHSTHWFIAWDGGLAEARMKLLPQYKAQRPPMPDALASQIAQIQEYLTAAQIPWFQKEGIEADDAIAAMAKRAASEGATVAIASADKDFMQLVGDRVALINPNDQPPVLWDAARVREKTGVAPCQVADWLSLIGDGVDNIPGVAGIGPKTATILLDQFGSIDGIYARLNEVKPAKRQESLRIAVEEVKRNQKMIRLMEETAVGFALDELAVRMADSAALEPLYRRWGFKSLLRELQGQGWVQGELL